MITFAYNPTSWRDEKPIPGGMADVFVQPIAAQLAPDSFEISDRPLPKRTNVYYAFRSRYALPINFRVRNEAAVFVSHGIADKNWRTGRKLLADLMDHVFVSGPLWAERTIASGFPADRVHTVGYTKLDPIFNGEVPESCWTDDGRVRVLWAPTHGGGGEHSRRSKTSPQTPASKTSSWWAREEILSLLPEGTFQVLEAPHPRHRPDGRSTLGEYVGCDVVIADGGSTIYEAWALGLPVVFPDWIVAHGNIHRFRTHPTIEADLYIRQIGRHATMPSQFAVEIELAASEGITAAEEEYVEPILPVALRGQSARRHAETLCDIEESRSMVA